MVSELVAHKQIDVAVRAFSRARLAADRGGRRAGVARVCAAHAAPNVRFAGRLGDAEVARLMATCRAFVVTANEEFGIAAVEAQAAGRPVIARKGGGVLETVEEGDDRACSGRADPPSSPRRCAPSTTRAVDPQACVRSANRFGADVFRRELPREVKAAVAESAAEPHEGARRELRRARRRAAFGPRRPSGIG